MVEDSSDEMRERFDAWRAGDTRAGALFIDSQYDAIARYFATKAAARDAPDLVQSTFARCAAGLARFAGDGSPRAFVFGIARNVLLEYIRTRVRARDIEPDFGMSGIADLLPGVETQAAQNQREHDLSLALNQLSVDEQTLLELHYWEGLSMTELAESTGLPPGTVKSRLHAARRKLRDHLDQQERTGTHPLRTRATRALPQIQRILGETA